jgi:hypothetical protein
MIGPGGWGGATVGLSSVSWGARWTPPTFASAIKCHQNQKSTSNSVGSSVGSLAPPPGHPTAGRCVRVVPVLPVLLCTLALRELGLRLGVKAQLLPGGPNALSVFILDCLSWLTPARASKSRSRGTMHRAGVVLLWSSRDMHSGAARCPLGHVTHFTSRKSCAVGPPASPENFVVICSLFVLMR